MVQEVPNTEHALDEALLKTDVAALAPARISQRSHEEGISCS